MLLNIFIILYINMTAKHLKKEQLDEMVKDLYLQNDLYKPGNFWDFFIKNMQKKINSRDLKNFRSWPGGPPGDVHSFGAGEQELGRKYGKHFHPYDLTFESLDNSFLVKIYNSLINRLSKFFRFISFISLRASAGREYFFQSKTYHNNMLYDFLQIYDKELLNISDTNIGNPIGFYRENKFYTTNFLFHLTHVAYIKKHLNYKNFKVITELGSGYGALGYAFLQLNPNVKYITVDIPPASFFAEYYFNQLGYKTAGYNDIKNIKSLSDLDFNKFQVFCIPSWKSHLVKDINSDLFVNVSSFQEMEKAQTQNYLNIFSKSAKNIYLFNLIDGHKKAIKKKGFGVLEQTNWKVYTDCLNDNFTLFKKDIVDLRFRAIFNKKT